MSREPPSKRLKAALTTLTKKGSDNAGTVTVAALCRAADVSRNSLYRYHPELLGVIRAHRARRREAASDRRRADVPRLRGELIRLRKQAQLLASLVDHYCAAYREARLLLERRDRELSELRRSQGPKPLGIRR